jgi:hypothetical protein
VTGPANYDYGPPSPKFHRNGSHILPQGYRGLANSHKKWHVVRHFALLLSLGCPHHGLIAGPKRGPGPL